MCVYTLGGGGGGDKIQGSEDLRLAGICLTFTVTIHAARESYFAQAQDTLLKKKKEKRENKQKVRFQVGKKPATVTI